MTVWQDLRAGKAIDMTSSAYQPVIEELRRADRALYVLNHTAPGEQAQAWQEFYPGGLSAEVNIMTPVQIDFPSQLEFKGAAFVNHSLTAMAIGGITIGDGVMIGPNVTIVTDNHDFANRNVLKCRPVVIEDQAWIGAGAKIMPGVTVGKNAVVAGGAVVTKDVAANTVVGGNPARVIRELPKGE